MKKLVEKSMLGQTWVLSGCTDFDTQTNLSDDLVKNVLASRGITDAADVAKFLSPTIKDYMPDPFVLQGMQTAAGIIADAVCDRKKIVVYGDYDSRYENRVYQNLLGYD